ncbi:MAG: carbohydrate porin, partial [Planctomycetota bacterium]
GKIDPGNFYNRNRAANQNELFVNRAFSNNPARRHPGNGLGINARIVPSDDWYVSLGFQDANGRATSSGFNTFGDVEWFYAAELGLTPTVEGRGRGNYRFTTWWIDEAEDGPDRSGGGIGVSFDQEFGEQFAAFFRYAWQDRGVTDTRQIVAGGFGVVGPWGLVDDVVGVALSWGQPSDRSLRDQYVGEVFYRIQLTPKIRLTPSYQVIIDPSESSDQDLVGVFSLRYRVAF